MSEDLFQVNRTTQVTIYNKILDIVYKKPWILLRLHVLLLIMTMWHSMSFIIAWNSSTALSLDTLYNTGVIFSDDNLAALNGYKNTKASTYSRV